MSGSSGGFLINPNTGSAEGGRQSGTAYNIPGGRYIFAAASSNWNGATCTLQICLPDGVTYIAVGASSTFTANAISTALDLPPANIKAVVTGGPPTALFASIARVVG